MSTIQLSRTQRRQIQKLADKVDLVTQADRRFFERFPHRQHRVRLASHAEIAQNALISGEDQSLPAQFRHFVAVRNLCTGVRMRLHLIGLERSETDLAEEIAKAIYESASTEQTRKIEADLCKAVERRR